MPADNPFAPPTSASLGATDDAWAEGDELVTLPEATLPLICAKCGHTEDVQHVPLKVQWTPFWARLTILLSPIVFLIVYFIVRKKAHVQVGLCPSHRSQRMMGMVGGYGALGVGILALLGGVFTGSEDLMLMGFMGGMVLIVVGVLLAVLMAMPLRVIRVSDSEARFKGAHPELLDAVGMG